MMVGSLCGEMGVTHQTLQARRPKRFTAEHGGATPPDEWGHHGVTRRARLRSESIVASTPSLVHLFCMGPSSAPEHELTGLSGQSARREQPTDALRQAPGRPSNLSTWNDLM